MPVLFTNEILSAINSELRNAKQSVQIITAYCKEKSIKTLDKEISSAVAQKRILLRFRMSDIVCGSTDFSVAEYCLDSGWEVYIRFDLHAKTYIVDDKRGIVGSANVTNSGLTGSRNNNLEMATLIDIEEIDRAKIKRLFESAIMVDQSILQNMRNQIENTNISHISGDSYQWDNSISDLFQPRTEALFSYEFPDKIKYENGEYVSFLDSEYSDNIDELKQKIRWSNAYLWLLDTVKKKNGEIYFGELSAELHNDLVADPKPYRKDVKMLLANLLFFIEICGMDEMVIDRPKYSQRISIKNK